MTRKEEFKEAIELLEEIEENVGICCAITMEPDEVLLLIDRLREILDKYKDE
jgi:3-deoxy-D-arabino-heptulosonate 7-phosphate (DAHP) synthase class II